MKKYVKLSAFLLACLMMLSLLAGCGGDEVQTENMQNASDTVEETVTEVETEAMPDVERNNYGEDFFLWVMNDTNNIKYHFVEEGENDVLSEAIFARQEKVREYLGVNIVGAKTPGTFTSYASDFKTAVKNKDGSVDMMLTHVYSGVCSLVSENYLFNLADLSGVDLDAEYWNQEFMEDLSINGKYFLGNSDYNILSTHVVTFNKDMMDKYADALPKSVYDMVRDYEWTVDQMISLANLVYIDETADGKTPDDTFGISGRQWNEFPGFLHASDIKIIDLDESGSYTTVLTNDVNAEKTYSLIEKLYNLAKSDCSWFDYQTTSLDTVPLTSNRTLMHLSATGSLVSYLEYEIPFGVLPSPLYDTEQKDVGYRHLQWGGYISVPVYMRNAQIVGETLEVLSFFSEDVKVAYYEKMLGKQVADVPDDSEMLSIVWDTVCCEFAQTYSDTLGGTNLLYLMATVTEAGGGANAASTIETHARAGNGGIIKFFNKIEKANKAR